MSDLLRLLVELRLDRGSCVGLWAARCQEGAVLLPRESSPLSETPSLAFHMGRDAGHALVETWPTWRPTPDVNDIDVVDVDGLCDFF